MPTQADLDRLKRLAEEAKAERPPESDFDDEAPTVSREERQSKVHVQVNLHHHDKAQGDKGVVSRVAESPWGKGALVLLLGAGGSEGHHLVATAGLVTKAELEAHKQATSRELGAKDAEIAALRAALVVAEEHTDANARNTYALGTYLYGVLPKMGVLVTLPEGIGPPAKKMEFHPPPLYMSVGPNAAKPIQPKDTFPLPEKP